MAAPASPPYRDRFAADWARRHGWLLDLTEPGPLGAVGRDENPLIGQGVIAAVRLFSRVERHGMASSLAIRRTPFSARVASRRGSIPVAR